MITRYVGDTLGTNDAKEAVSDNGDMPDNTHYSWVVTPDTSSTGLKSGEVQIAYPDNSTGTIMVHVNVKPLADKYTPLGQNITISEPSNNPLSGTDRAKDGISNTAQLPADVVYTWATPVDISQADTTVPGIVKITYHDNSVDTVAINVIVGHPESNPQTDNPVAKIINVNYGDVLTNDSNSAKRGVQTTSNIPSDAVYNFVGTLPTDSSNKVDQTGDIPVLVHIVGTNYDKNVATVIHVVSDSQRLDTNREAPIGQDIYAQTDHVPDPKKGIMGADDPESPLADAGASYTWATGGEPDVSSVGTKSGVVQVNYRDGSSKLVPVTVIVTADGNPVVAPGSDQVTAGSYKPFSKGLERQMSSYNTLDEADAQVAVGFPEGEHVPSGTKFAWVDPNFAQNALRSVGYKTSQVEITYPDGSQSIVLATVHVTNMADTYTPAPQPITVDPDNPYLPDNLNDPDNPNPAIDPSTLPSGALVRFPDGVKPSNLTPGDHPVQLEVDYPDGTKAIVPTVIHVPAKSQNNTDNNWGFITPNNSLMNMPNDNGNGTSMPNTNAGDNGNNGINVPNENTPSENIPTTPTSENGNNSNTALISDTSTNTNGVTNDNGTVDTNTNSDNSNEVPATPSTYQKLVLYIGRSGRIVKKAYITVSEDSDDLASMFQLAKAKEKMPKGYKATGKVKLVAKHLDVWVNKLNQPAFNRAPKTKDVLYVAKNGKIVKRTRITGDVRKLAKSKLPRGYKITGIDRVNNHYNVWIKK